MVCKHYYRITIGILYTETFTIYLLFISLNFAGFFGKREIIVMLIILICYCATLRAVFCFVEYSGLEIIVPLWLRTLTSTLPVLRSSQMS